MKKFGTPTGAGPGSAKLKVGFVTAGTPVAERSGRAFGAADGFVDGPFAFGFDLEFGLTVGLPPCDFGWLVDVGELGWLAGAELEVELEVEEDREELELCELLDEDEDEEVVVVVVPVGAVQDWVTPTTGREVRLCGSTVLPAGSATLKTSWRPPATVTVTVQGSAEALATGMATSPATTAQHMAAATLSFMRMVTRLIPPTSDVRHLQIDPLHAESQAGRYWLPFAFATRNRSVGETFRGRRRAGRPDEI